MDDILFQNPKSTTKKINLYTIQKRFKQTMSKTDRKRVIPNSYYTLEQAQTLFDKIKDTGYRWSWKKHEIVKTPVRKKLEKLINKNNKITLTINDRTIKVIQRIIGNTDKKILMSVITSNNFEEFLTLNKKNIQKLGCINQEIECKNSWKQRITDMYKAESVSFEVIDKYGKNQINGAFFKYTHNITDLDLLDFQIYNYINQIETKSVCCFIKALEVYGLEKNKILQAKSIIRTRDVPMCRIKQVAEELDIHISVRRIEDKKHLIHYGNKQLDEIKLGLIDEHYFLIKPVEITSYALKNYFDIYDEPNFNKIIWKSGNKFKRSNERFISSYDVIKILIEYKDTHLKKITKCDELYKTQYYDKIEDIASLDYSWRNLKKNEYKEKEPKEEFMNVFADFETITDGIHQAYLCRCDGVDKTFEGVDCGLKMLYYLCDKYDNKNIRLFFHNAGYDIRFMFKYLTHPTLIDRGKMLLRGYGKFYYAKKQFIKVEIQDSYAIIPEPLRKFSGMFNLDVKKEILPYGLYTKENVNQRYIDMNECLEYCKNQYENNNIGKVIDINLQNEFVREFVKNAEDWNCIENGKVDIIQYSSVYCKYDVEVLKDGYETFKNWMMDITELNIDNYISLASIANDYLLKEGVYDGVYQMSGVVREFIEKCMVGGRTMLSNNQKNYKQMLIDDFDAVSLYPSAMKRLGGLLQGKPKVIRNLNFNWLKDNDGYFVEIKINKVGKKYNFPLMSEMKDGVRLFTNNMVGKTLYVDKITLEDLIKFQAIEFEIVRGYYYDEGRNDKLGDVIDYLFNERVKAKANKNPIQAVFKLLMNSAYGKSLLKAIDTETKYITEEKFKPYVAKYYNWIKDAELCGKIYKVKKYKSIVNHFNNEPCGVEILSMSKRIMNEVMCLAEDLKIPMFYQDTDSIHIDHNKVELLGDEFKSKYNRELIGSNMSQFHTDFQSDIIKGDIVSNRSIYLGKKCYIDELIDVDDKNIIDYHVRLKGIPNASILHYCKKESITPFELYEQMYNGKAITFDLTCDSMKVNFKYHNNMNITTLAKFERTIRFK